MDALLVMLGVLGGLLVGVVAAVSFLRRDATKRNTADVDELAIEVARIARIVRRTHMQQVRLANPREEAPAPQPRDHKAELRQRVFGHLKPRAGNGS